MDSVDHLRNPGMSGRKTSNDTRLAAVGVDDVWTRATKMATQPQVGQSIHQRANRPNKTGLQMQKSRHRSGDGFKRPFRSTGEARDEFHLPIRNSPQAKN